MGKKDKNIKPVDPVKDSKKQKKLEAESAKTAHEARQRKINRLIGLVTAVLVVLVVAVPTIVKHNETSLSGEKFYKKLGRKHVTTPVKYAQTPPVGGNHNPLWLNCAIYNRPVPNENAVHSLEHSAVWVTYDPKKIKGKDLATLQSEIPSVYVILSPYPGLPSPIVASAWGVQLKLKKANDTRISAFIAKYAGSPLAPEPGGECTGGLNALGKISNLNIK